MCALYPGLKYNAFISYSHAADGTLAPQLEKALQRFGIPWWKKRVLNIFRDESSLSATPQLWSNITEALDASQYLIFMASPRSAQSKWVTQEIAYWLEHKSADTLLIALTEGSIYWGQSTRKSPVPADQALPEILRDALKAEPFYVDFRSVEQQREVSLKNPLFQKEVLKLAAQLHGKAPKDLAGEELSARRRWSVIRVTAFVMLAVLLGAALYQWRQARANEQEAIANKDEAVRNEQQAVAERNRAREETRKAVASSLVANANFNEQTNPTLSFRLAESAYRFDRHNPDVYGTLLRTFYSNLHFYGEGVYGTVFRDARNPPLPVLDNEKQTLDPETGRPKSGWPLGFMRRQGLEVWGGDHTISQVIVSADRNYALFRYSADSDLGGYRLDLWDLQGYQNRPGTRWFNEDAQVYYDEPMLSQTYSRAQGQALDGANFSPDSKYAVIPDGYTARVIRLEQGWGQHGRFHYEVRDFRLSHSKSQLSRVLFAREGALVQTVNFNGDTATYDLEKFALPRFNLEKSTLYADTAGCILLLARGRTARCFDLRGEPVGAGRLNPARDGLESVSESFPGWDQLRFRKVLDAEVYNHFTSGNVAVGEEVTDEELATRGNSIKDSLGREVIRLTGHANPVRDSDRADDGRFFLTTTCPRTGLPETKLWDHQGRELLTLTGFGGRAGFLPGSRAFYTYDSACCLECPSDTHINIWPIDPEYLMEWVGANGIYSLSPGEMEQFGIDLGLLGDRGR